MSNKAHCPGCDSYLSSIYEAFEYGGPCPNCGLPADAAAAVEAARNRHADEALVQRCIDAEKKLAAAEKELSTLRFRLQRIGDALTEEPPRWG